jgi:hypothetical protein
MSDTADEASLQPTENSNSTDASAVCEEDVVDYLLSLDVKDEVESVRSFLRSDDPQLARIAQTAIDSFESYDALYGFLKGSLDSAAWGFFWNIENGGLYEPFGEVIIDTLRFTRLALLAGAGWTREQLTEMFLKVRLYDAAQESEFEGMEQLATWGRRRPLLQWWLHVRMGH